MFNDSVSFRLIHAFIDGLLNTWLSTVLGSVYWACSWFEREFCFGKIGYIYLALGVTGKIRLGYVAADILAADNNQLRLPSNDPVRLETAAYLPPCMRDVPTQPRGCLRWCCRRVARGLAQLNHRSNR